MTFKKIYVPLKGTDYITVIPTLQMRKPSLGKVIWFIQNHVVNKCKTDLKPVSLIVEPVLLITTCLPVIDSKSFMVVITLC